MHLLSLDATQRWFFAALAALALMQTDDQDAPLITPKPIHVYASPVHWAFQFSHVQSIGAIRLIDVHQSFSFGTWVLGTTTAMHALKHDRSTAKLIIASIPRISLPTPSANESENDANAMTTQATVIKSQVSFPRIRFIATSLGRQKI